MRAVCLLTIALCLILCQALSADRIELPVCAPGDQIVQHKAFTLKYCEEYEQADWVAYRITADALDSRLHRTNDFRADPDIVTGSATLEDYRRSGYDRGHLAPAASMRVSPEALSESFLLSNMSPQRPGFNRGIWRRLEEQVRAWAREEGALMVVTGPLLEGGISASIGPNKVGVPRFYYKVVLDDVPPSLKAIGFILPHEGARGNLAAYACSVDEVERQSHIDFFCGLPDELEERLESGFDLEQWPFGTAAPSPPLAASKGLPRRSSP